MSTIDPIQVNEHQYFAGEILQGLNYGGIPLEHVRDILKSNEKLFAMWDKSLVQDFANCLFGDEEGREVIKRLFRTGSFDSKAPIILYDKNTLPEPWTIEEDFTLILGPIAYHNKLEKYFVWAHSIIVRRLRIAIDIFRDEITKNYKQQSLYPLLDSISEWENIYHQTCRTFVF